jgi:hypothetical protein
MLWLEKMNWFHDHRTLDLLYSGIKKEKRKRKRNEKKEKKVKSIYLNQIRAQSKIIFPALYSLS